MALADLAPPPGTTSLVRAAAAIGFGGGLLGLVDLLVLHAVRPDLAPGGHVISEYAISYAPLGAAFFALQSVGCLALAVALTSVASSIGVRIGVALLALAGVGLGLAVFAPMDPLTTPPGQETLAGQLHGVAALIGIPSFIATTLVLGHALRKRAPWQGAGGWLVGLGHLTWISLSAMVLCMVLMLTQGWAPGGQLVGWANRMLVVAYGLWLMIAAWPLLKR